jgi:hypothetical protein
MERGALLHSLQNLFFTLGMGRKPQITVRNGNLAIQPYGNPVTEKSNLAIGQYSSLLIATGRKSRVTSHIKVHSQRATDKKYRLEERGSRNKK